MFAPIFFLLSPDFALHQTGHQLPLHDGVLAQLRVQRLRGSGVRHGVRRRLPRRVRLQRLVIEFLAAFHERDGQHLPPGLGRGLGGGGTPPQNRMLSGWERVSRQLSHSPVRYSTTGWDLDRASHAVAEDTDLSFACPEHPASHSHRRHKYKLL